MKRFRGRVVGVLLAGVAISGCSGGEPEVGATACGLPTAEASCPVLARASSPTALAREMNFVSNIVASSKEVFWTATNASGCDPPFQGIQSFSLDTCRIEIERGGIQVEQMIATDDGLYFSYTLQSGDVIDHRLSTTSRRHPGFDAAIHDELTSFAVDDAFVYWIDQNQILRLQRDGGQPEPILSFEQECCPDQFLAVDDTSLYALRWPTDIHAPEPYDLFVAPKDGSAPFAARFGVASYRLAGDEIFFTDAAGSLFRVAKAGGVPALVLAGEHLADWRLTGKFLYWTDGPLKRMPLGGGPITSPRPGLRQSFGVGPASVYWVDTDDALVRLDD
jgi:hypothetical protein